MALDTSGLYKTWPIGSEVRADGRAINTATQAYGQLILDTRSTWTALDQSFHEPQNLVSTAQGAYDDLIVGGTAIGTVGSKIRDALVTYGDAVDALQDDRRRAKQAARDFAALGADDVPESGAGSEQAVQQQIDRVVSSLQDAMDTCAETLNGLELELDIASFSAGPVPTVVKSVLKDGLGNLDFSDITYTDFHRVKTVTNPTVVNKLVNTNIDVGMKSTFPFIEVDIDTPGPSTDMSHGSTTRTVTKSNFLLPAPMMWMGKLPFGLGEKYRARVGQDGRASEVKTTRGRARNGGVFSRNGQVVKTTTTTRTDTSHRKWRPTGDSNRVSPTTSGTRGALTRVARYAGPAGDVVGVVFTYENAYNETYESMNDDPRYAGLSPEQREREIRENATVKTVTDTGIDFAAGATGAAVGAAFGGPIGAVAGFGIGLGLSLASDQDWFGGTSVKDWVSDKANSAVDGLKSAGGAVKDKWNDWFG